MKIIKNEYGTLYDKSLTEKEVLALFKKFKKEAAMKTAIFHLTRVIGDGGNNTIKGKEYVRVDGWEHVKEFDDLPTEYRDYGVNFFEQCGKTTIVVDDGKGITALIWKGINIPAGIWFNEIESILKASGERLSKILKEQKWYGSFEVKI